VSVSELSRECSYSLLGQVGKQVIIAMIDGFKALAESFNSAMETISRAGYGFDNVLCCVGTNEDDRRQVHVQGWYILKPIVRVIGRLRCRWRLRESRKLLEGLSTYTAVLDGDLAEEEEICHA
jgi:hypothetical protein